MKDNRLLTLIILMLFFMVMSVESFALNVDDDKVHPSHVSLEINLTTNQLCVLQNKTIIKRFPIALGKRDTPTPVGDWEIINKYKNWGKWFGTRWLGLNVPWGTYGIHGTNNPSSIGSDASHGCIRMLNRHVEQLFDMVQVGTKVHIIGHPLGEVYHEPRRLARGDNGADVMLIQSRLKSAGYYKWEVNGKFTYALEVALKRYEKDHHLPVHGVVSMADYISLGLVE